MASRQCIPPQCQITYSPHISLAMLKLGGRPCGPRDTRRHTDTHCLLVSPLAQFLLTECSSVCAKLCVSHSLRSLPLSRSADGTGHVIQSMENQAVPSGGRKGRGGASNMAYGSADFRVGLRFITKTKESRVSRCDIKSASRELERLEIAGLFTPRKTTASLPWPISRGAACSFSPCCLIVCVFCVLSVFRVRPSDVSLLRSTRTAGIKASCTAAGTSNHGGGQQGCDMRVWQEAMFQEGALVGFFSLSGQVPRRGYVMSCAVFPHVRTLIDASQARKGGESVA